MAQSPLGNFANLSRYQQAPTQTQANVLDQFIQALNQGVSLAQLPQTIQQENQLKQQQLILGNLKAALAQQQLTDLQNPDAALARKVKEQITLQNVQNQLPGAEAAPAGLTGQTIFAPGAVEGAAGDLTGITTRPAAVPLGASTTPIAVNGIQTGFNYNPQIPIQAAAQAQAAKLENLRGEAAATAEGKQPSELEKIRARNEGKGAGETKLNFNKVGNKWIGQNPFTGAVISQTTIEADKQYKNTPAGLFVINPNDENDTGHIVDGTQPIAKPAAGVRAPAELINRYTKFGGVLKNIDDLEKKVNDLSKSGKFPSAIQRAISTEVSMPPTGAINSLYQSALKGLQSDDAKSLEATRAQVAESIVTTLAGLAQTGIELRNLAPFTPQSGEPLPDLISKMKALRKFVNNERGAVEQQFPGIKSEAPSSSAATPTNLPKIISITPVAQ